MDGEHPSDRVSGPPPQQTKSDLTATSGAKSSHTAPRGAGWTSTQLCGGPKPSHRNKTGSQRHALPRCRDDSVHGKRYVRYVRAVVVYPEQEFWAAPCHMELRHNKQSWLKSLRHCRWLKVKPPTSIRTTGMSLLLSIYMELLTK